MPYLRTDLAIELHEAEKRHNPDLDGVKTQTEQLGEATVTRVEIQNENGAEKLGKPKGKYITLEMASINFQDTSEYETCCNLLKQELSRLHPLDQTKPVLVVGLGNRFITADALGPKAVDRILVTRHMHAHLEEMFGDALSSVCAVAPGVLGITGVETAEIVEGVCARVKPGLILVIDALAARDIDRLNTTVQLSDAGIAPGSGVGNTRVAFNQERFGVPVIAIGVPTVIDTMTMLYDAAYTMLHAVQTETGDTFSYLQGLSDADLYGMIENLMQNSVQSLTVTPKDVDQAMDRISKVIAGGINLYLHEALSVSEMQSLTM